MSERLERFGPLLPGESGLAKRLRFHQSWYRSDFLAIPDFGSTPGPVPRPLGSILPLYAADHGKNFTSPPAEHLYIKRRARGWGVDPVRCTQYLTSSQALTLNFLGPLYAAPGWLLNTLSSVLGRSDLLDIAFAAVEHAPARRSQYLGDMTRVDGFIVIRCRGGYEGIVLEFKYADRFNSRDVRIVDHPKYRALAARTDTWKNFDDIAVQRRFNQLVRCHALGVAMLQQETGASCTTLLVVHHGNDARAAQLVTDYGSHMSGAATAVGLTLAELCDHMAKTAGTIRQLRAVEALEIRYGSEAASERWWKELGRP